MPKSWSFRASIPMRTGGDDIKGGVGRKGGMGRPGGSMGDWQDLPASHPAHPAYLAYPAYPAYPALASPTRVVEVIGAEHIAPRARVHVRLPRRFFSGDHGGADVVGDAANIGEDRAARGRHEPRHRARLPEREPLALERAHDAAVVARLLERDPAAVELVGSARDRPDRPLIGLCPLRAPRIAV